MAQKVTPVQINNPYCFRAYDSGGTTIADDSETQINLATENYDYNNNFASSTYTVPVTGVYHISAALNSSALTNCIAANLRIKQNTTVIMYGGGFFGNPGLVLNVNGDALLSAGDTIKLFCYQNSDASETTATGSGSTWMSGFLVRAT